MGADLTKMVGHIPFDVDLSETLAGSQYSLEHIDLRPIGRDIPLQQKEEMIAASGKWVCPTLVVYRNIQRNPKDILRRDEYASYVGDETKAFRDARFRPRKDVFVEQKAMAEATARPVPFVKMNASLKTAFSR